jgi:hypothetical protein
MGTLVNCKGVANVNDNTTTPKKDVVWNILGTEYKIQNVPFHEMDSEELIYFDADVSLKLAMIRDLMFKNEIPTVVNYDDVTDLRF